MNKVAIDSMIFFSWLLINSQEILLPSAGYITGLALSGNEATGYSFDQVVFKIRVIQLKREERG